MAVARFGYDICILLSINNINSFARPPGAVRVFWESSMTSANRRAGRLAAIACLAFLPAAVFGSVITQTQVFGFGAGSNATFTAEDPPGNPGGATVTTVDANASGPLLTFNQFDDLINGPLAAVSISFEAELAGNLFVELTQTGSVPPVTVGMDGDIMLDLGLPGGSMLSGMLMGSVECTDPFSSGCSNDAALFAFVADSFSPADLTPYIGGGTFDVSTALQALIFGYTDPDNGTDFVDNATLRGVLSDAFATGSVTVEYFFGVPEPGVLVLFLIGLPLMLRLTRKAR